MCHTICHTEDGIVQGADLSACVKMTHQMCWPRRARFCANRAQFCATSFKRASAGKRFSHNGASFQHLRRLRQQHTGLIGKLWCWIDVCSFNSSLSAAVIQHICAGSSLLLQVYLQFASRQHTSARHGNIVTITIQRRFRSWKYCHLHIKLDSLKPMK